MSSAEGNHLAWRGLNELDLPDLCKKMSNADLQNTALLKRVTTKYIAREDRIRLTGATSESQVNQLWLTQRILSQVVPHLCKWLEQTAAHNFQEFAQQRAVSSLRKQPAVKNDKNVPGLLICAIDVQARNTGLTLTFKGPDGTAASRLQLNSKMLRQWLSILYDQYVQAGWQLGIWPDWITEAHPPGRLEQITLLH